MAAKTARNHATLINFLLRAYNCQRNGDTHLDNPNVYLIGASAAIFTLIAVVLLVKPLKFSFIFFMPLGLVALIYIIYNVVAVQTGVEGNVAYISHVIGFAVGIPLGVMWSKNLVRNLLITLGLLILYLFIIFVLTPYLLQLLGVAATL